MNNLDKSLDECAALTENTREEVRQNVGCRSLASLLLTIKYHLLQISGIQREADTIAVDFKAVHLAVHVMVGQLQN